VILSSIPSTVDGHPVATVAPREIMGMTANSDVIDTVSPSDGTAERPRQERGRADSQCDEEALLHDLISARARRYLDRTAVRMGTVGLSYGELDRRSNQIARVLINRGVRPEQAVAVHAPRDPKTALVFLGLLKAGGVYLPLDQSYPADRLRHMAMVAKPPVLVTDSPGVAETIVSREVQVLPIDDLIEQSSHESDAPSDVRLSPENAVYIIFTSGSTGVPKGIVIEHRSACNQARALVAGFGVTASDHVLQQSALSFDPSISEFIMAWGAGAKLCFADPATYDGKADLARIINDMAISVLNVTPSVLSLLKGRPLPSLKTLVVLGEAPSVALLREFAGTRRVINAYGPSETTMCSTFGEVALDDQVITIGQAIPNVTTFILDEDRAPVPPGVTGELYIGGVGVARGYLGSPDLTAERFLECPLASEGRLYRTGDLARVLEDGRLQYLGRTDRQVKIRGNRVELEEIEKRIASYPGIAQVAVTTRSVGRDGVRLVAYVVHAASEQGVGMGAAEEGEAARLQSFLRACLPEYMVPEDIMVLPEMPLTVNGKVDIGALPELGPRPVDGPVAVPVTALEKRLCSIVAETLPVERPFGIDDNILDLGANSMTVLKIILRVQDETGRKLSIVQVMGSPTVRAMAAHLDKGAAP
jgi:amino acid adenylation domain-containing protein